MELAFVEKIKEIYYSWEDKWYAFLDKLNEKGIPIYKIIDPIDRLVPSFALFIFLILLGIGILAYSFFVPAVTPVEKPAYFTLTVEVLDEEDSPLPGIDVTISYEGYEFSSTTNTFGLAEFDVPAESFVTINIDKEGYEKITKEVVVDADIRETVMLKELSVEELSKTLVLKDLRGRPVRNALVSFHCTNKAAIPPEDAMTDYTGTVTVVPPSNCGKLIASVKAEGYAEVISFAVDEDFSVLQMQPLEGALGSIRVSVTFEGNPVDNIKVKLYQFFEQELGPIDEAYSSAGLAIFESVAPGTYIVKTEASQGYAATSSENIQLDAGQEKFIEIKLEKRIIGEVQIRAVDEKTYAKIANARVTLRYNEKELATAETDAEGIAKFPVSEDFAYEVIVDHEDYLVKAVQNVHISATPIDIKLTKYIPGVNGGNLKVKVVNKNNEPIENARVALFNVDTKKYMPFEELITDFKGEVIFTRVDSATYKVFAFKKSLSGWSDEAYFDKRKAAEITYTVVMEIPNATLEVHVKDEEGNPVQFAMVSVYNAFDNNILASDFTNAEGYFSAQIPADKGVYIRASKEKGTFYSTIKYLEPNGTTSVEVLLPKRLRPGPLDIQFKGLYKNGSLITNVSSGQRYLAKFYILIPENNNYEELGIHIRTGRYDIIEKDPWFIKEVNIPAAEIIKGVKFTGKYSDDIEAITFNEAKWIDAKIKNPGIGVYEADVLLEVKQNVMVDEKLSLYYKAHGTKADGTIDRSPEDVTPAMHALYDATKEQLFQIGIVSYCDEEFCFDAQIYDKQNKLVTSYEEIYEASVFGEYNLKFNLINNSKEKVYNNAFLRIYNPEKIVWFMDYELFNSETGSIKGTLNGYKFADYSVGNFTPQKRVFADIDFTMQKAGNATIVLQLIADNRLVYEKTINLTAKADKDFVVEYTPKELPSGIENTVSFTIKDASNMLEVEDALVAVYDRFDILLASGKTSRLGKVQLKLPAQNPGENLKLRVKKAGYNTYEEEIKVKAEVVEFTPSELAISLNASTKHEGVATTKIKNVTMFPVKIDSVEFVCNSKGLLDLGKINEFLAQYKDFTLDAQAELDLIVKAILSSEGKNISELQQLECTTKVTVTNFGMLWSFDLPLKIDIGLGNEVDNPDCLSISKHSWKAVTEGQPLKTEFEIINGCTSEGKPISLRDLGIKFEPEENLTGTISVELREEGELISKATASTGYFKTLINKLDPEKRYQIIVNYYPYGGIYATQKGKLIFQAVNPTKTGMQNLTTQLNTELIVANIRECVIISKERVVLDRVSRKGSFYIETKNCGGTTEFNLRTTERSKTKVTVVDQNKTQST